MLKEIKKYFRLKRKVKKFLKEYESFELTKIYSKDSYIKFRSLFVETRGEINDKISVQISNKIGKYANIDSSNGILGSNVNLPEKIKKIQQDGYVIFEESLSEKVIESILKYAQSTPVSYLDVTTENQDFSSDKVLFDEKNIVSPRYQFTGNEIIKCPALQELVFDSSLLYFAQEYLGCKPILDLVAFWWSAPFEGKGKSAAAQMYHFDLDRIKFMKFFFYITDVDTNTGPHCYVKGSHTKLPKQIDRDGRFEDEEIEKVYGATNLIEICGKKGSIMAVDTRGFHKGKDLLEGKRLLFQIQFTNSLFGQQYDVIDYQLIDPKYKDILSKYNHTYNNIS